MLSNEQAFCEPIINEIMGGQRERRYVMTQAMRCDRSCEAYMARMLKYHSGLPKAERDKIWTQVSAFRKKVEAAGREGQTSIEDHASGALSASVEIIRTSALARSGWDSRLEKIEADMRAGARKLPVWKWAKTVKGINEIALAKIVGETSDLSFYDTKEQVWKRAGLAVINGQRQQKMPGAAALDHRYNPVRRSEFWNISVALFKAQWRGDQDEDGKPCRKTHKPVVTPAHAIGPYGEAYRLRREHTKRINDAGGYAERAFANADRARKRGETPNPANLQGRLRDLHLHNDAVRIMLKFFLENLWRVWNGKEPIVPAKMGEPRDEASGIRKAA